MSICKKVMKSCYKTEF